MKEPLVSVAAGVFHWRLQPEFLRTNWALAGVRLEDWLRAAP